MHGKSKYIRNNLQGKRERGGFTQNFTSNTVSIYRSIYTTKELHQYKNLYSHEHQVKVISHTLC